MLIIWILVRFNPYTVPQTTSRMKGCQALKVSGKILSANQGMGASKGRAGGIPFCDIPALAGSTG